MNVQPLRFATGAGAGDRPLRILMPSYRSDPRTGGQGVYMRYMTRELADMGHAVDVISGPPYPDLDPRVRLIELPSLDLYTKPKNWLGIPDFPWSEIRDSIDVQEWLLHVSGFFGEPWSFGERLAKWIRGRAAEYDVVHDNQTLARGLLAVMKEGLPVVGTIHHPISMDRRIAVAHAETLKLKLLVMRWYGFIAMQKKVARRINPFVCSSEASKRDSARDFGLDPRTLNVCYLGIDTRRFHPLPGVSRNPDRLMTVASADVPLKGLVYLVRALALLAPSRPDLELLVIGKLREGPTAKLIAELGVGNRIRFVSGVSDEELNRLYNEAGIAVCPSVYEGFGFPAGEAMATGAPMVSSDGGSLPEVVGDAGLVVPAKDPAALAAAIGALLDDSGRRAALGQAARERIVKNFLWRHCAEKTVAQYRRAIESHADRQASRARA